MGTAEPSEQVTPYLRIDSAYEDFDNSLLSSDALVVLWRSFSSEDELAHRYLLNTNPKLADRRVAEASFTDEERGIRHSAHAGAANAKRYLDWAINEGAGQPILRSAIVSYCVAFETFLKNVAIAFALASRCGGGLREQFCVPRREYRMLLKEVRSGWRDSGSVRVRTFFEEFILQRNPGAGRYPVELGTDTQLQAWEICEATFAIRNAVVHEFGCLHEQIEFGHSTFFAGQQIELKPAHLGEVSNAMRSVARPFNPLAF